MSSSSDTHQAQAVATHNDTQVTVDTDLSTSAVSDGVKPKRTRRRLLVSCVECHRRKRKCNREVPCESCVSRYDLNFLGSSTREDVCCYFCIY